MKAWFESRGHAKVDLRPGRSGQFDVVLDGDPAYSRYETGRFPSDADLEIILSLLPKNQRP
ncbi:MAG TPA: Rdx family protein [Burkholderiaceae bacterium]|nr:Rdx family protein [Burkholderiaceae bacterium]